mmetsp:Transcript_32614/g.74530  ORF Transcript_32614/g.74530 Transcript_32614/m.74530 type:complete len:210 (-) Transcript_32614:39-668(-)
MVRAASLLLQGAWTGEPSAPSIPQVHLRSGQHVNGQLTSFEGKIDEEVRAEAEDLKHCVPEVVRPRLILTQPSSVPDELRMSDEHVAMEREAKGIGEALVKLEKASRKALRSVTMPPSEPIHVLTSPPLGQLKAGTAPAVSVARPEGLGPGYPERQIATGEIEGLETPQTSMPNFDRPPFPGYVAGTRSSSFLAVGMRGSSAASSASFL